MHNTLRTAVRGILFGGLASMLAAPAQAVMVYKNPEKGQHLNIMTLVQTHFRYQEVNDSDRPNFVDGDDSFDTSFRRIRLRLNGGVTPWFKFNWVMRLNRSGQEAFLTPFGGSPSSFDRQNGRFGDEFNLHELDLIFALDKMFDTGNSIWDAHLGFPRVPLGREQYAASGFSEFASDRQFSTLRWTHLTVGDVTGRSLGGFIHTRQHLIENQGYRKTTLDLFGGVFDGFKGVEQPFDETVRGFDGTQPSPSDIFAVRGTGSDDPLFTLRAALALGDPEGKPKGYHWLYSDTKLGRRHGLTLGASFATQSDIDQELLTDTQGPLPGFPNDGAGSAQTRVPFLFLPNPFANPAVIGNGVDMTYYSFDFGWHHGPYTLIGEFGRVKFDDVLIGDSLADNGPAGVHNNLSGHELENDYFIAKAAYAYNAGGGHVFEPFVTWSRWDPDTVTLTNPSGGTRTFGDGPVAGQDLGRIDTTEVGVAYWYKNSAFGAGLSYQFNKEENNDFDNDALVVNFRFRY